MEIQEALKIIKALADGVNPETGEVLAGDLVYRDPQNIRALHRAVGALEFLEERERDRRLLPKNAGKPWSSQEEAQICDELRSGTDFKQIARTHNRSVASIVARLIRLGKVPPRSSQTKVA
jgi:hypothetical protein